MKLLLRNVNRAKTHVNHGFRGMAEIQRRPKKQIVVLYMKIEYN